MKKRKVQIGVILLSGCLFLTVFSHAQTAVPSMAIIEVKSKIEGYTNDQTTTLFRLEQRKTGKYSLIDAEEMKTKFIMSEFQFNDCFDKLCIINAGRTLGVDFVLTATAERIDQTTMFHLKLYDIQNSNLMKEQVIEFNGYNDYFKDAISEAISIFEKDNAPVVTKNKSAVKPTTTTTTNTNNTNQQNNYPPHISVQQPSATGVIKSKTYQDAYPKTAIYMRPLTVAEPYTKLQFGIQHSLNNILAFKLSPGYMFGSEDQINVSFSDFNEIKRGLEFRGEMLLRPDTKVLDVENYTLYYFSMEGVIRHKSHKDATIYVYDPFLLQNVAYTVDNLNSQVYVMNFKMGLQSVIQKTILIDAYCGAGLRRYIYNNIPDNANTYMPVVLPNFVLGFDVGYIIK